MSCKKGPEAFINPDKEQAPKNRHDGLQIKFPYAEGVAGKVLCVICDTGLPNEGAKIKVKKNIVTVTGLDKDPSEIVDRVTDSAERVMGPEAVKPDSLRFRRITLKELRED